jgi:hypothetical protein
MAFLETLGARKIIKGKGAVQITLAGSVTAGDPVGYSAGWVLSADAATIQPILIAGQSGSTGQVITAYMMAEVYTVCTLANVATLGDIVGVTDAGLYAVSDASTMPEVGFVSAVGSDSLSVIMTLFPMIPQLTVVRS